MIGAHIPPGLAAISKFMTIAASSCLVAATVGVSSQAFGATLDQLFGYLGDMVAWGSGGNTDSGTGTAGGRLPEPPRQGIKYLTFPLISGAAGLALITGYNIWKLGDNAVAAYLV